MALPRCNRLVGKKEFNRVFKEGRTVKGSFLFIKARLSSSNNSRFGFIVPSKIYKNAVDRNRIKRILSEIIYLNINKIKGGQDVVIVVRARVEEETFKNELLNFIIKTL
ncbi:MAG: ribonuclease P protein component [Candidatus Yanofskybacteria bacterium RIFCSPHIGHO2_01_FULL_39_8b]|uniref:Ribonuclease P protein component n=1 Tax=Candidatus Yanofskybacteria bacterium RIFCSPHIGHO2_01_FULL_39_8b TaxID=1802659 RepID=A0A1F8EHF9_9BACT|nr:MAG: ribonuclease P protein component [Candidatus Yanofskybacteria bacterium RIFCSPHIGHO2_01_FULL_39_8b]